MCSAFTEFFLHCKLLKNLNLFLSFLTVMYSIPYFCPALIVIDFKQAEKSLGVLNTCFMLPKQRNEIPFFRRPTQTLTLDTF